MAQRYQQPQGNVRVNWSNPISRGLRVAINPGSSAAPIDATGRSIAWNAQPGRIVTNRGLMFQGNGSTTYATLGPSTELASPTAVTCFSIWLGDPAGDYYAGDSTRILVGGIGWRWGRTSAVGGSSSGNLTQQKFTLTAIADYTSGLNSIASKIPTPAAFSINGTSLKFYEFGLLVNSQTISASRSSSGSNLIYGGNAGLAEIWKDAASITYVWDRELSAAEHKSLSDNPWQLFAPQQQVRFAPAAGGGGTSVSVAVTEGADTLAASASVKVSVTSNANDGADVLSSNVSVITSASSTTTDGADVLSANVTQFTAVSSATTDGADTCAANVTPQTTATSTTSATTDGADVLASSVSVIAAVSSSTTDGADTLASNSAPLVAASSATTDGADTLSAAVGPQVAAASATTDGVDVLAASAGPIVGVSSATVDGADTLLGNVVPVQSVALSAAIVDGADVLVANVFTSAPPSGGAAPSSEPRKTKRFLVNHAGETLGFDSRRAAERAVYQLGAKAVLVAQPVTVVDTAARLAAQRVLDDAQDEDDIEMLLLSL